MTDPKQGRAPDAAAQTAAPVRSRIHPAIVALGAVSLLNDIAGDAVQPLLPAFVAMVGGGPVALGVIEGIADATSSLLQIISGYVADRTRHLKALTLAGYGIANLLRPLLALVGAWWQILAIRFGDRAGKGVRTAPRDALLAYAAPPALRGRGYGLHRGMEYIGALVGPGAAYLMLAGGLPVREVFAWTAVPGVICLLVLGLFVRDIVRGAPVAGTALGLPPSAVYRRFLVAIFVFTLGSSSDTFLLWRAGQIGIGVELAPVLWMLLHLVKSASSFLGGAMSDRYGRRTPILAGWTLYAAVYVGFAFAAVPWQIWALFACYGFFFGLTESAEKALVVDLVEEEWRGRALGTYHAAIGLASLPASVIFGVLYEMIGPAVAFGMGAAMAVLAALILPRSAPLPGDASPSPVDTSGAANAAR